MTRHSLTAQLADTRVENARLFKAVEILMQGLRNVQTKPAEQSAFIAAVFLQEAKEKCGVYFYEPSNGIGTPLPKATEADSR